MSTPVSVPTDIEPAAGAGGAAANPTPPSGPLRGWVSGYEVVV